MTDKRVFVAVDISTDARLHVADYMDALRRRFPNVRCIWTPPENLHITAWFIGGIDEEKLERWKESVSLAGEALSPFTVELEGTGVFSQYRQRTNVLWLGVRAEPSDRLIELGLYLNEDKRVKPHLTIGRLKNLPTAREMVSAHSTAEFGPISFNVNELVIYESKLSPTGSTYTPIYHAPFQGRNTE